MKEVRPGSMGHLAALDDTATPAVIATNTIYFDAQRPSAIILPVMTEEL